MSSVLSSPVLAIDEGTTSARAALYNERGERIAMHAVPFESRYPHPGWVEQDAMEIWHAQMSAVKAVAGNYAVTACGITNQRETTVMWDRQTGEPVAPAIVWQCRRTAEMCAELARSPHAATIENKTGLVIDAYFSASKIRWILDNVPDARAKARDGEILFGNIDTWLIWNLTGGAAHVTDPSNASRTMLMDLETGAWDDELLAIFDVPRAVLPQIVPFLRASGCDQIRLPGRRDSYQRNRRRSAGSSCGAGMLSRRAIEKHLRHRMLRAHPRRRAASAFDASFAGHSRGGCRPRSAIRGGGQRVYRGRGDSMAAR